MAEYNSSGQRQRGKTGQQHRMRYWQTGQEPGMDNSYPQSWNGRRGGGNSYQQYRIGSSSQQSGKGRGKMAYDGARHCSSMVVRASPFQQRCNERGINESYVGGVHLGVDQLQAEHVHSPHSPLETNQYIGKPVAAPDDITEDRETVPHYPRPVEFRLSKVTHVTTEEGLNAIVALEGFTGGKDSALLWWGFAIGSEEIAEAEQRYLDKLFPDRTQEEKKRQMPFLPKFTSSPVFKDGSCYGNFRFTLPLEDVLQAYSTQFCGGAMPVVRVWETIVYKQEIMYSVLVHSPDVHCYDSFPILGDNEEGVCAYRNGEIIWRAQAISETHEFRLRVNSQERRVKAERVKEKVFNVWDHVALAFHFPSEDDLPFPRLRLLDCLTACPDGDIGLNELIGYKRAREEVDRWDELRELFEVDYSDWSMGEILASGSTFGGHWKFDWNC